MAARRRRRWLAIGGATAAVAVCAWSAIGLAAPANVLVAPSVTNVAPHLTFGDDSADGAATASYDIERASPDCSGPFAVVGTSPSTSFDDTGLPGQGTYCYRVTGHYAAGTKTTGAASVNYDTAGPAVTIGSPLAGTSVAGTIQISASALDAGSGVASLRVSVDGLIAPAPSPLTWNTAQLGGNGPFTVEAVAIDNAGNESTATTSVTVDNTPPAAPAVSPLQSPVAGSPTLTWQAAGGETYTVARNGTQLPGNVLPPWTDTATVAPGTYTYVVTAKDAAGNTTPSPGAMAVVIPPSLTAPRALAASSPTSAVPHLTWQAPVTFAVTGWQVYRDGAPLQPIADPSVTSFDDTTAAQGSHTYSVQALSGASAGDMSGAVAVTYDNVAPLLDPVSAIANADGSIAVSWPPATDPAPGSGVARYVVRRGAGASGPPDAGSGTAICTLTPPASGCTDASAKSGVLYGYAVFAQDAAGNLSRREASAKALDSVPPGPVTGLQVVSSDRTYVRLGWTAPKSADTAGYRVLLLRQGVKAPLNPADGTIVCNNDDPQDTLCDSLNLTTGQKVTYAVYAYDGVPNYSPPVLISAVPHSIDKTPPHRPTKVVLTHEGLVYTLKWVTPRDPDLSKFRVTLLPRRPSPRPAVGKAVVTGRVLHATFKLVAGQKIYVNLFALDVTGNFSRVSRYVVAPQILARSKHKLAKRKPGTRKPKHAVAKQKVAKRPAKPVTVAIAGS